VSDALTNDRGYQRKWVSTACTVMHRARVPRTRNQGGSLDKLNLSHLELDVDLKFGQAVDILANGVLTCGEVIQGGALRAPERRSTPRHPVRTGANGHRGDLAEISYQTRSALRARIRLT
jgi:hypothetical protein